MTNIIAVVNQKGGVGKTTTCANLGVGLAQAGKRVLLLDTDPQGSLAVSLGFQRPEELSVTISDHMTGIIDERPLEPKEGMLHHAEGVDIMPANIELSGIEVTLVNTMMREKVLKQYVNSVKKEYDFILVDCMPSLGMLAINALTAADSVLIPGIARPLPDGGYEIISGHRRKRVCELAGFATMPFIIWDRDDDAATILMCDGNLQRETILPSERAFAYKLKLEALKH